MPRLSICIPTYCQIEFLRHTLRSIQAQDFNDYELIISDDSPNDTVKQLVASFNFDSRLRYYHNPVPLGSPANWNEAVRLAKGSYIKLLHHDDKLDHPSVLSTFVRLLDEHPEADFAFSSSRVEDVISRENRTNPLTEDQLERLSTAPEKLFFGNVIGAPSATIYRNGLGIEYDCSMKWLVDIDFYIRILQNNHRFAYTSEALIVTPTNAAHQVTEICKNNAGIELFEYMLLFQKVAQKLLTDPNTRYVWFRLFEKYQIYSQEDLELLGANFRGMKNILEPFFRVYQQYRLQRTPYRFYARLPDSIKVKIRAFNNLLKN